MMYFGFDFEHVWYITDSVHCLMGRCIDSCCLTIKKMTVILENKCYWKHLSRACSAPSFLGRAPHFSFDKLLLILQEGCLIPISQSDSFFKDHRHLEPLTNTLS